MSETRRILVVDDHFEMLEFLRSMLELSNPVYKVTGVPSAEEGLLELQQTAYDLLITDLRLPGISGFDLIRRARVIRAGLPIIMITGYSSAQGWREAADLGVVRYFTKPLDTDGLLAAVQEALYGLLAGQGGESGDGGGHVMVSAELGKRLEMLQADTGAVQAVLARVDGQIVSDTGGTHDLEMPALVQTITANMGGSFQLARILGSHEPFTIQYQAGQLVDVYSANVGRGYVVALFFDAQARRGRIGTIWLFAQRAVRDLLEMLDGGTGVRAGLASPPETAGAEAEEEPAQADAGIVPGPLSQPSPAAQGQSETGAEGLLPMADALNAPLDEVDLDAFWSQAASETAARRSGALSWEEAVAQGLIPADLGQQEP